MTIRYIIGNGTGSITPSSAASWQVDVWGAGAAGGQTSAQSGGAGAGWARLNSFSATAGAPVSFSLGAPGTTSWQNGGDTWFSSSGTLIAPGGANSGTPTTPIGDSTRVGVVGNNQANIGNCGGTGASGPNGAGNKAGDNLNNSTGGSGGGGNGGGVAGAAVGAGSVAGTGGNGFAGTGGAGGNPGAPGGLGAGGGGLIGGVNGNAGNGGDDYDNGGGGGGGGNSSSTATPTGGRGGTPGGGGGYGSFNIANSQGAGGWAGIRISYPGSDPDQIIFGGTISLASVVASIPASWNNTYTVGVMNGGFTVLTQGAPQFLPSVYDSPKLITHPGLIGSKRPQPLFGSPWRGDFTPPPTAPTFGGERLATRSPFRLLPGRGPRPLVPNPWRGDFSTITSNADISQTQDDQTASITASVGAEPIAARSPFRLLPGRGPRPLVPNPWRYYVPDIHAAIVQTQDDQTASITATNLDTAAVVQTQDDQTSSITASVGAEPIASRPPFRLLPGRGPRPLVPQPWRYFVQNANAVITATQDDQTAAATATIGAEPIAARSPFRLLPGRGPRPLVPQPWRYYVQDANATVAATQDDQTSSITATIGAEPLAVRSPFRLLPGRGPRPLVPNPWRGDFSASVGSGNAIIVATQDDQTASIAATNLDHVAIVQTQDDQTASITATSLDHAAINQTQDDQTAAASVGAVPIASRSPFRLLPGRGPRPLVPNPWRYVVQADLHGSIVQTQDDQTISAAALLTHVADIDQNQDDHTISSTATLLAAATIAQAQSNQTIVSAATNRTHAAIVQTQDDQTIVATALLLLPRTAAIVQTQQDQTIHMTAGLPRAVVAQPQFLW